MTASNDFDRTVAAWLDTEPTQIRSASVDAALEAARQHVQRRGLRAAIAGVDAWPTGRRRVRVPSVPGRVLVVVALLVALIAAAIVGAGAVREEQRKPLGGGGWITASVRGGEIHVLSPDGSVDRATPQRAGNFCPHLSPDGDRVAYSVRFQGLFFEPLDGTGRRPIPGFGNFGYMDGIWSPDRARLVFRTDNDGQQLLRVASMLDDSVKTLLKANGDDLVSEGAWSPDSRRIAVAHARGGSSSIAILGLDGTRLDDFGPFPISDFVSLAWSPDGSTLAYLSPTSVITVDVRTGARHDLAASYRFYEDVQPWSPDSQWLAVNDNDGSLQIVRADGTQRTNVPWDVSKPGLRAPRWSPVDDVLAVPDDDSIHMVRPDGAEQVDRKVGLGSAAWNFDWSPDGSKLVVGSVDAAGDLRVVTHDAFGDAPPVSIAAYPAAGNDVRPQAGFVDSVCVGWESGAASR